jgi:hypothetical protein
MLKMVDLAATLQQIYLVNLWMLEVRTETVLLAYHLFFLIPIRMATQVSTICTVENLLGTASRPPIQKYALSSHITPWLTPKATPKIMSTSASPRQISTTATPKLMSGATSPTKSRIEAHMSMTPWYPSSKQSSAASSPPRGGSNPGL